MVDQGGKRKGYSAPLNERGEGGDQKLRDFDPVTGGLVRFFPPQVFGIFFGGGACQAQLSSFSWLDFASSGPDSANGND